MKTGEEVKVDTFSSGEQQLIDVAFMFGLQRFLEKINNFNNRSIFIDELFDASIDIDNLDKIISVDRKFVKVRSTAFMRFVLNQTVIAARRTA